MDGPFLPKAFADAATATSLVVLDRLKDVCFHAPSRTTGRSSRAVPVVHPLDDSIRWDEGYGQCGHHIGASQVVLFGGQYQSAFSTAIMV